jgi:hypothetical protein
MAIIPMIINIALGFPQENEISRKEITQQHEKNLREANEESENLKQQCNFLFIMVISLSIIATVSVGFNIYCALACKKKVNQKFVSTTGTHRCRENPRKLSLNIINTRYGHFQKTMLLQ